MQLTRVLLQRAREDETHPLPVVFHLSSWAEKRLSFADWLIEELKSKYQVPRTLAQQWVTNETLLPLLDGLDEVVAFHRAACVETMNHYRQEHSLPMVVCSRSAEYLAQGISLRLHRAVVVQPLTPPQVDQYLLHMLPHPTVLRDALAQDEVLRDMATNSLTLSTVAYRDQPLSRQLMTGTIEQRRTLILSHYVERVLTNRGPKVAFAFSQTRRYFTWLAQEMLKHNQVTFYLERLQPDWLPVGPLRERYEKVALRFIYGLEIIVTTALYAWMRGGRVGGSTSTFGVGAGLLGQLGAGPGNTVFSWMAPGLGGGVEAGESLGLVFALVFSITTLLIGGSPFPLTWTSILGALKQGAKHLLIAGGVVSLLCLVIFSIFGGWRHGLIYGGGAGIFAGVVIGLLSVFANLRGSLQAQRRSVRTRLVDGAIIGLCGGVSFALVDILLGITTQSVLIYTFIISIFTFCAFSFGGANKLLSLGTIQPAETISWSWHTIGKFLPPIMMQGVGMTIGIASCVGMIFTLVSGAFYGFEYGIRYGLIAGLIAGVVVGW